MIYLSAILVVLAFGLLVVGVVTGTAVLVMWSIVASVLSAVFLMIGALLRRHELFPSGGTTAATVPPMPPAGAGVAGGVMGHPGAMASPAAPPRGVSSSLAGPMAAPHTMRQTATLAPPRVFPVTGPVQGPVVAGAGGRPSSEAIVLVIPGRKRFHLPGCRQLAGREFEELTHEEAREEGFSACTTCLPDGDKPDAADKARTGYRSEETRPVKQTPAEPAMESIENTPGRAGAPIGSGSASRTLSTPSPASPASPARAGADAEQSAANQTSSWKSDEWFAARPSAASKPAEKSPATASSKKPDASAASSEKPAVARDDDDDPVVVVSNSSRTSGAPGKAGDSGDTSPAARTTAKPAEPAKGAEPAKSADSVKSADRAEGDEPTKSEAAGKPVGQETSAPTVRVEGVGGATKAAPKPDQDAEEPSKPVPGGSGKGAGTGHVSSDAGDKPRKGESTVEVMRPGIVKVIPGTRRYHSSACPLIKGSEPSSLETMSRADAEAAGLTHCSVCDDD